MEGSLYIGEYISIFSYKLLFDSLQKEFVIKIYLCKGDNNAISLILKLG